MNVLAVKAQRGRARDTTLGVRSGKDSYILEMTT